MCGGGVWLSSRANTACKQRSAFKQDIICHLAALGRAVGHELADGHSFQRKPSVALDPLTFPCCSRDRMLALAPQVVVLSCKPCKLKCKLRVMLK